MSVMEPVTRLGEVLEAEGRKQSWLSEQTGIDPATLNRMVRGYVADAEKQERVAKALGRKRKDLWPA